MLFIWILFIFTQGEFEARTLIFICSGTFIKNAKLKKHKLLFEKILLSYKKYFSVLDTVRGEEGTDTYNSFKNATSLTLINKK